MQYILRTEWPDIYPGEKLYLSDDGMSRTIRLAKRFDNAQYAMEWAVKTDPGVCWLLCYETGELVICRSRHTECDSIADALETGFDWWTHSDVTEFAVERKDNGRVVLVTEHPLPPRGLTPTTPNYENNVEAWLAQYDRVIAQVMQA